MLNERKSVSMSLNLIQLTSFFFYIGRHLHISNHGFLLGQWHVFTMGVLLSNHRHIVGIWSWKICKLHQRNDREKTRSFLGHFMEIFSSKCYAGEKIKIYFSLCFFLKLLPIFFRHREFSFSFALNTNQ